MSDSWSTISKAPGYTPGTTLITYILDTPSWRLRTGIFYYGDVMSKLLQRQNIDNQAITTPLASEKRNLTVTPANSNPLPLFPPKPQTHEARRLDRAARDPPLPDEQQPRGGVPTKRTPRGAVLAARGRGAGAARGGVRAVLGRGRRAGGPDAPQRLRQRRAARLPRPRGPVAPQQDAQERRRLLEDHLDGWAAGYCAATT